MVFAIVSLPLSDSLYGVQLLTMLLILSCMFVKFLCSCFSLLSISNPRMVKLSVQVIPNSGQMMSVGSFSAPMGITCVLSKLQLSPLIEWKSWMYFVAALRFSGDRCMNNVVSSANASALASVYVYAINTLVSIRFLHGAVTYSVVSAFMCSEFFLGDFHSQSGDHSIHESVVQLCIQFFREVFPERV